MKKHIYLLLIAIAALLIIVQCKDDSSSPDDDKNTETEFTIYTNASDPLFVKAQTKDGMIVEYFGSKDDAGNPIALEYVTVKLPSDTDPHVIKMGDDKRPGEVIAPNGTIFRFNWINEFDVRVTATSPNGGLEVNFPVNIEDTLEVPPFAKLYSIDRSKNNHAPRNNQEPKLTKKPISTIPVSLNKNTSDNVIVSVSQCDGPLDKAHVALKLTNSEGKNEWVYANALGNGQYGFNVPVAGTNVYAVIGSACQKISSIVGLSCELAPLFENPAWRSAFCFKLAAAIDLLIAGPTGEAVPITAACTGALTALDAYCKTAGNGGVTGGQSPADFLCNKIVSEAERLTGTLTMQLNVKAPNGQTFRQSYGPFSANGPFQNFTVDLGGSPDIQNFITTPSDPAPNQGYTASANIICPSPQGSNVTISVVGTDGYTNSRTVTFTEKGEISLYVPGASDGVSDQITISIENGPSKTIVIVF